MITLDSYSEADVIHWLGAHEVAKGRGYVTAVSDLVREGDVLRARVSGTESRPYQVMVQLADSGRQVGRLVAHCSCPVRIGCKHAAATLLAWLARREDPNRPRQEVLAWIETFRSIAAAPPLAQPAATKSVAHALLYLIRFHDFPREYGVSCFKARLGRDGGVRGTESWSAVDRALDVPPAFVDDADLEILRLLRAQRPRGGLHTDWLPLEGRNAEAVMVKLAACGRAHFEQLASPPLRPGAARPGTPAWVSTAEGLRAPALRLTPPAAVTLPLMPPWYIDRATCETGPVELDGPAAQIVPVLRLPPLKPVEAELVSATLAESAPTLPLPMQVGEPPLRLEGPPVPVLRIGTLPVFGIKFRDYPRYGVEAFDYATLAFRYGPVVVEASSTAMFHTLDDGRSARIERDRAAESAAA